MDTTIDTTPATAAQSPEAVTVAAPKTKKVHQPRNTDEKIAKVIKCLKMGMSQEDAANEVRVSGWTVAQWKKKGKLGDLPKGKINKKDKKTEVNPASVSTNLDMDFLKAENAALKTALKALVAPEKMLEYHAKLDAEAKMAASIAAAFL